MKAETKDNPWQAKSTEKKAAFMDGVYACVPTLLGYLSIGFAAGVVAKTAGLSVLEITLMSLLLYAGSAQFIAASMIGASFSVIAIAITIFFINIRHLLMTAALAPYLKNLSIGKNILIGAQVTDETFGVAANRLPNMNGNRFYWMLGLNITAYINWVLANALGGLFGELVTDISALGIDFALPAMFAGLLVLQMISRSKYAIDLTVALLAIALVIGVHYLIPGSWSVIIATLIATTIGMVIKQWK
ncbi:MAG: Branched-chain amino acid permease AzlC [Shouchella clausii]|jgi:4-azaleucine resistance transporter AzlC